MKAKLVPVSSPCIKIKHATRREAEKAAKVHRDRKLNAYLCSSCHAWHIGHGELGRRSSYKFSLNRRFVNRTYLDRLDRVFNTI